MAATRDKRANAGSKMSSLIEAEDEDDFYKTTYGGFNEEEGDNEYQSEVSESDIEDSDMSIDENDDVRSDMEDDEPKRKRRVITKAYKEPAKPKPAAEKKPKEKKSKPPASIQIYQSSPGKKALRKKTSEMTKAVADKEKERVKTKMMRDIAAQKRVAEVRRLTQEELLEEAKVTEELNRQSLETYRRLELERKKSRIQKQVYKGPLIRYHSLSMPLIEELPDMDDEVETEEQRELQQKLQEQAAETTEKCSRTFITFTDERIFKDHFPCKKHRAPVKQFCPVTRLPAKYYDPITQTPYATLQAFKMIREAYSQQCQSEGQGNKKSKGETVAPAAT